MRSGVCAPGGPSSTSGVTAPTAGSLKRKSAASAQPGATSVSSLSTWTPAPPARAPPALAATQKPADRSSRTTHAPNAEAVWLTTPPGDPSSTTSTCVPGGRHRRTLDRHSASRSARLWLGMTIDRLGNTSLLLAHHPHQPLSRLLDLARHQVAHPPVQVGEGTLRLGLVPPPHP